MQLLGLLYLLFHAVLVSSIGIFQDVLTKGEKDWKTDAIRKLWMERAAMQHTPLVHFNVSGFPMTNFLLKNETVSTSGTLKHRFAWGLVMWAVLEGKTRSYTIPLLATPERARPTCARSLGFHISPSSEMPIWPKTDTKSTNMMHEIDVQLNATNDPLPDYFIHSSGTGGTISSVGRYIQKYLLKTKVVLADSEHSLFGDFVLSNKYSNLSFNDPGRPAWVKPGIPGIGYGYNTEPIVFGRSTSLDRSVIDEVARMPDIATVAAMRSLHRFNAGASTALNFLVSLSKAIQHKQGLLSIPSTERISIALVMGDPASFYASSYLNDSWVNSNMGWAGGMKALNCWQKKIDECIDGERVRLHDWNEGMRRLSSTPSLPIIFFSISNHCQEKAWKAYSIQKLWEERLRMDHTIQKLWEERLWMDHTMDIIYFKTFYPGIGIGPAGRSSCFVFLLSHCTPFETRVKLIHLSQLNTVSRIGISCRSLDCRCSTCKSRMKPRAVAVSGTLKHRFVWALMLWAVTENKINAKSTLYDSTSGNTGSAEAYMARLIGVPFVAVVSKDIEEEKIQQIKQFDGQIYKVESSERNAWAAKLARNNNGFFINQFGNADKAEEYHESGGYSEESSNVFHEIVEYMKFHDKHQHNYFIHSAGTGGTISSVGKYITRYLLPTMVVLADSEHSLFADYVLANNLDRSVIDEVARMPDIATVAALRSLRDHGIDAGASTAVNFLVSLSKALAHKEGTLSIPSTERISIVTIMGDPGSFYTSYLNDTWVDEKMGHAGGLDSLNCWKRKIDECACRSFSSPYFLFIFLQLLTSSNRPSLKITGTPRTQFYIKNETASPSGTLKHRFVWMLLMWAVTEGKVTRNSTVYDSTSGNTGASEAYMCRLLGLTFVAVVSKDLEDAKIKQITQFGGEIMKVEAAERNAMAAKMAEERAGFFINQFGNADAAEEFYESGNWPYESANVFHEIGVKLRELKRPLPHYFVHSAGTGRPAWVKPGIAGIGYGYNSAPIIFGESTSLDRSVIDEVARMPDMATVAAMRSLRDMGIDAGASTALNFLVALCKAIRHKQGKLSTLRKERLRIVFIMGDPGHFYASSYLNDRWVEENMVHAGGIKTLNCWKQKIDKAISHGSDFMDGAKKSVVPSLDELSYSQSLQKTSNFQ
ncbi:hypothetical protein PRIPAC_91157, partial [Pristionchus pacificus]|uniref:Uncharacterized protein n=1 Tax=Pristionchus pacificus TaxID=54126 RepID=A0A2A6CVV2_PRIPA